MDTIGRQVTAFVTMFMAAGLIILMYMIFEPQRQAAASNHQVHTAVERGAELFAENCVVCHGTKGEGRQGAGFTLNTEDNKAPTIFSKVVTPILSAAVCIPSVMSSPVPTPPSPSAAMSTRPRGARFSGRCAK